MKKFGLFSRLIRALDELGNCTWRFVFRWLRLVKEVIPGAEIGMHLVRAIDKFGSVDGFSTCTVECVSRIFS